MKRFVLPLVLCSSFAFAEKKISFMPENDLHKEDRLNELSQITEKEFGEVIDQVANFYKPIVESHGGELKVTKHWKSSTVNAYSSRASNVWKVDFFGGLARRKEVTKDGFQMVVCHEFGHHLGGFPFVVDWAANDGESDYFATLTCARELWKNDFKKNAEAIKGLPKFPKKMCDQAWPSKQERELCYRIMQAGKSLSDLLSSGQAKYETPSTKEVTETDNEHPTPPQCRLDTYMAGSICRKKFDVTVIPQTQKEAEPYSCFALHNEKGYRPKCWFKEEE